MKSLVIIIVLLVGLIASYLYLDSKAAQESIKVGYQAPVKPAPDNVSEYPPKNAIHHGDGLYSQVIKEADADTPSLRIQDRVYMNYTGWRASDGGMFDTSANHRNPYAMKVNATSGSIEGWLRIIPEMREGEIRRVWIPQELAYKDTKNPNIAGRLVFDMEVKSVDYSPRKPDFYSYTTEPEASAIKSPTGLVSQIVKTGDKSDESKGQYAVIHLTKWSTDGELIQSSELEERPVQLDLNRCIPALKEAITSMKVGEIKRCWIPSKLGYGENPPGQQPKGDFICDIQLISRSEEL